MSAALSGYNAAKDLLTKLGFTLVSEKDNPVSGCGAPLAVPAWIFFDVPARPPGGARAFVVIIRTVNADLGTVIRLMQCNRNRTLYEENLDGSVEVVRGMVIRGDGVGDIYVLMSGTQVMGIRISNLPTGDPGCDASIQVEANDIYGLGLACAYIDKAAVFEINPATETLGKIVPTAVLLGTMLMVFTLLARME